MGYLDNDGLIYLWGKIKNKIASSTYVHPTTDGNKHVPATGTANNGKVLKAGSTAGTFSWQPLIKGDVGLSLVDNTADMSKPVSTLQRAAINGAKTEAVSVANAYTDTKVTGLYKYKGSVVNESNLPTTGQITGDVYDIQNASSYGPAGTNVAWNGTRWDSLGGSFSVTNITNAEIDAICV